MKGVDQALLTGTWVAGILPVLFGVTSVMYQDITSSLGVVWAVAAITWGVVFVAAAELTKDAKVSMPFRLRGEVSESERA